MAQDFILFAVAVLPSLFIADYIYKHDNTDVEPMGLLRSLFLLGAASCLPAALVEQVLDGFLVDAFGSTSYAYILLDYFVVVAGAEEGFKYLVLHWRTWKDPAFDHRFDGIVYTVMVGLGFATLENIMYVFQYGLGTGIVRAFLSVPGHAGWGVIMGYYYGRMKMFDTLGDQAQYKRARIAALAVPMLCHGLYDTLMSLPGDMLPFLVGVGFAIAIDVGVIKLIKSESQSDTVLLKQSGAQWGFSYYGAPTPAPAPAPAYAPAPAPQAAPGWQPAPRSAQPYAQQPAPAPQPAATYAQQPVSAPQPAAAYAQRPASVSQPAATYTQQRVPQPTYLYGQPGACHPSSIRIGLSSAARARRKAEQRLPRQVDRRLSWPLCRSLHRRHRRGLRLPPGPHHHHLRFYGYGRRALSCDCHLRLAYACEPRAPHCAALRRETITAATPRCRRRSIPSSRRHSTRNSRSSTPSRPAVS